MAKRKSTGKKQRFEIFKRDGFACQYCGQSPPGVVLVVDHIIPVASGGETIDHNLITACESCNQGKGAVLLTAIPRSIDEKLAMQVERQEQLIEFNKYLLSARKKAAKTAERLGDYWCELFFPGQGMQLTSEPLKSIAVFLKRMPEAEILQAMDIASQCRFRDDPSRSFKYFCGVCWKMIKGGESP